MSEQTPPSGPPEGPAVQPADAPSPQAVNPPPPEPAYSSNPQQGIVAAPNPNAMMQAGPVGQVRSTGMCILLYIVTLGIYSWYWYYKVSKEMKDHSGQGIGGAIALILAIFVGIVMPYVSSSEVGGLYTRRGEEQPVSAMTGLWYFPGMIIIVGPIIWFVKTNGALNRYWESLGAS